MDAEASQITSLTIVYSTIHSGPDQRKHKSSASLAFVRGIHRWQVNSPHKWQVTRKMFPFDDVIMYFPICFAAIMLRFSWHRSNTNRELDPIWTPTRPMFALWGPIWNSPVLVTLARLEWSHLHWELLLGKRGHLVVAQRQHSQS